MSIGTESAASVAGGITAENGAVSLTFSRKTLTSVSAGEPTFGAPTTATGYAFVLPPSEGQNMPAAWGKGLQSASLAGAELAFLWVAARDMAFAPRALDTVSISGATWQVLGCDPYSLGGVDLCYAVGVQKQ
jgi:hypothetical protein